MLSKTRAKETLRQLRKFNLFGLIFWFGSAAEQDRRRQRRTIRKAERMISATLLSI